MLCEIFIQTYNVTTLSGTEKGLLPGLKCLFKTMQNLCVINGMQLKETGEKPDTAWHGEN